MAPGDVLVCFSDGISEACNPQEELWQESDMDAVLRGAPIATALEVTERLVREADAFAGGAEQADDMTVVTIRLKRP